MATVELVRTRAAIGGMSPKWHRSQGWAKTRRWAGWHTPCGRMTEGYSDTLCVSQTDLRAGFVPDLCAECFGELKGASDGQSD